jgi:hypothetical protein
VKAARVRSPLDRFPFVEPRPLTSVGTPDDSWKTREERWERLRPARQRVILARLREVAFKEEEHSIIGWPAIIAWLHSHGFRNREGRPVNERTARGWASRLGMPLLRGCRAFANRTRSSPPMTSNYLLLAWAVSLYRSGGLDKPRIEGPGVPKLPRGKSGYSSPNPGASSSAPATDTHATPIPDTASRPRRFILPDHGAPPPTRRLVVR